MKKTVLTFTLSALMLCSCANQGLINSSIGISETSQSDASISSIQAEMSSSFSNEAIPSSQELPSSSLALSSSNPVSSALPNSSSSVVRPSSSNNVGSDTLPNGSRKLSAPENKDSPIDVTDWVSFNMINELPSYWRHIYGNNFTSPSFYASSHGGGVRMDQIRKGLQSPAFTSWKKLEVRVAISSVNNNSTKVNSQKNLPTMLVYGYDSNANLIVQDEIAEGSINANTKEVRFYLRNENMAYFELRLNAFPYKGGQCYNFGIGGISVKGWDYL